MDKISEFFKELKDRFSNPFFFSFIVGWLAVNWKIVIGLLFYSIPELEKDGYLSYFDLIYKSSNITRTFYYPLAIALSYTFAFPIFRNLIGMFNAWNQKWGSRKTLQISEEGKISVAKYIQLKEIYDKRRQLIEDVLEKESVYVVGIEELKNQKLDLQNKLSESDNAIKRITNNNDVKVMSGDWLIKLNKSIETKRVVISGEIIYSNDNYERGAPLFRIQYLAYNDLSRLLILVFENLQHSPEKAVTEVFEVIDGNITLLRNRSNKGIIIEMKKDNLI